MVWFQCGVGSPGKGQKHKRNHFAVLLGLVLLCLLTACGTTQKRQGTASGIHQGKPSMATDSSYDTKCQAVVKEIDTAFNSVRLYDLDGKRDITLSYNGGTNVTDQYGTIKFMDSIELGEIVDAYFFQSEAKLTKMQVSKDAWRYKRVERMSFHSDEGYAAIGNKKYQLDNDLFIFSDGELITLLEVNSEDELTVCGIGGKIYSVIITSGHGYVRFSGANAFLGGTVDIGARVMLPVTKNMMATVREGTYTLTMRNGELTGSKKITVAKNQEITIDMSEFKSPEGHVGKVYFIVSPEQAYVYVNGSLVDTNKAVRLNYGKHSVIAVCEGYENFTGTLTVGEQEQYIQITLAVEKPDSSPSFASPTPSPDTGTNQNPSDSNTSTPSAIKVDKSHKVTVSAPTGAEVYFNGAYKGIAPVSFTKLIGSFTITIRLEGYETKSYTVEIMDDDQDTVLSFPDLALATSSDGEEGTGSGSSESK